MPELHPSVSAVGSHLDEETAGKPSPGILERVEQQLHTLTQSKPSEPKPSKEDEKIEEAMHLDQ